MASQGNSQASEGAALWTEWQRLQNRKLTQKKCMLRCCGERKVDPIEEMFDSKPGRT